MGISTLIRLCCNCKQHDLLLEKKKGEKNQCKTILIVNWPSSEQYFKSIVRKHNSTVVHIYKDMSRRRNSLEKVEYIFHLIGNSFEIYRSLISVT